MGVIQRQGLKFSIVNWVGIIVGAFSSLFVFPQALEEYGLIRFLIDSSTLLSPIASLGANSVIIRFFPYFSDNENSHHGFLGIIVGMGIIGCLVLYVVFALFWPQIVAAYGAKNPLFSNYLWLIFPVLILTTLNSIFHRYALNFNRIVIPSLLLEVSQKFVLPILILTYLGNLISLNVLITGLVIYLLLVTLGFIGYIVNLKAWRLRPDLAFIRKNPALVNDMKNFTIHGIVGGFALLIISRIDTLLVSTIINLKNGGIYSISSFIANIIEVPARAVVGIGVPLLSTYWKDNNREALSELYKKTSINLLIIGLLLFGSFWVSVDAFFMCMNNSNEMLKGKYVIFWLALARIIDMSTGINNHILIYSERFRYSYVQLFFPTIISIITGIWLTQTMGLEGAALSNLIAVGTYNVISLGLNWHFFKFQPFGSATLKTISIALFWYFTASLIPYTGNTYLSIIIKSGVFFSGTLLSILYFKLSIDMNEFVEKLIKMKKM
jgi:O-antigen/teichoic acid export membrane protein